MSLMTRIRWTVAISCGGSIFAPVLPPETYEQVYRDGTGRDPRRVGRARPLSFRKR
jgi:hypothetical protein